MRRHGTEGGAGPAHTRFELSARPQSELRAQITAAHREDERTSVQRLLTRAQLPQDMVAAVRNMARRLVTQVRARRSGSSGVDVLMREFSLSGQEGVALMCLAEALLRIPDVETADRLIRDKWQRRLEVARRQQPSLFVNAAAWGLLVTGKLAATSSEKGLSTAFTWLIGKSGEPVIRIGVDLAMRLLGKQFVIGETIGEALGTAPSARRGLFVLLRHARRSGHDRGRCAAVLSRLRSGDPRHRRCQRRARHPCRTRHFREVVRPASALRPRPA